MSNLLSKICSEQEAAIDRCIPKLKRDIGDRLLGQKRELDKLPNALATENDRFTFLTSNLARLSDLARRCATADTSVLGSDTKTTNLTARIDEKLKLMKNNVRHLMPDFLDDENKRMLSEASSESVGYHLANFMQGVVFREHFHGVVTMLEQEATNALGSVVECARECLLALVEHVLPKDLVVPKLTARLYALINDELSSRHATVRTTIDAIVLAERSTTYTNNHYLSQTIAKFKEIVACNSKQWGDKNGGNRNLDGISDGKELVPEDFMRRMATAFRTASNEEAAVREMQITLHAYSKVVQKRFTDTVSILIINGIVVQLVDALSALSGKWIPQLIEDLVEDKRVVLRRKKLTQSIAGLEQAAAVLARLAN